MKPTAEEILSFFNELFDTCPTMTCNCIVEKENKNLKITRLGFGKEAILSKKLNNLGFEDVKNALSEKYKVADGETVKGDTFLYVERR